MAHIRLNARQAAEFAAVQLNSWNAMVSRGYAPPPDGREGIRRWWYRSTLEAWKAARRGRGAPGRARQRDGILYVDMDSPEEI
jgi:hypothetical protein